MSSRVKSSIVSTPRGSIGGGEKKKTSKKTSKKATKKPRKEKLYCGVEEPLPKTYTKFGSMKECAEKNQVKRYGRYKLDSKQIKEKENKLTKLKLYANRAKLMGSVSKYKRLLKNPKLTEDKKQEMKDDANKIIREIKALDVIIKKL